VLLVGFIIRNFVTMHGHMNVKGAVSLKRRQKFLGAFAKSRKETISFVKCVSVLPSLRMKELCSQPTVF